MDDLKKVFVDEGFDKDGPWREFDLTRDGETTGKLIDRGSLVNPPIGHYEDIEMMVDPLILNPPQEAFCQCNS
jgi:hypothetical protein